MVPVLVKLTSTRPELERTMGRARVVELFRNSSSPPVRIRVLAASPRLAFDSIPREPDTLTSPMKELEAFVRSKPPLPEKPIGVVSPGAELSTPPRVIREFGTKLLKNSLEPRRMAALAVAFVPSG